MRSPGQPSMGSPLQVFSPPFSHRVFTGGGVKGDDRRVWLAPQHHQQAAVLQHGGTADAEEGFGHIELGLRFAAPHNRAVAQAQAEQDALCTKCIAEVIL
jgi:hypothetical protein